MITLRVFMQTYISMNIIGKVEPRQKMCLAVTYYRQYYILIILYIFSYNIHFFASLSLKIFHKCIKTRSG